MKAHLLYLNYLFLHSFLVRGRTLIQLQNVGVSRGIGQRPSQQRDLRLSDRDGLVLAGKSHRIRHLCREKQQNFDETARRSAQGVYTGIPRVCLCKFLTIFYFFSSFVLFSALKSIK